MLRGLLKVWTIVVSVVAVVVVAGWLRGAKPTAENAVGVVKVEGVIDDAEKIVEMLDDLGANDDVQAVVLRVNSPGGAVAPSQEIYDAVFRVRERNRSSPLSPGWPLRGATTWPPHAMPSYRILEP